MPSPALGLPALATRSLALLLLGSGIGLAVNGVRADGVALSEFAAPVVCGADELPGQASHVELLPPAEAAAACSQAAALIIDARSAAAFAAGHVAGALHLPCSASDDAARVAESGLGAGGLLLVYADNTQEALPVARQLKLRLQEPAQRVAVLDGGFSAWREANLACASGGCPRCGEEHAL